MTIKAIIAILKSSTLSRLEYTMIQVVQILRCNLSQKAGKPFANILNESLIFVSTPILETEDRFAGADLSGDRESQCCFWQKLPRQHSLIRLLLV